MTETAPLRYRPVSVPESFSAWKKIDPAKIPRTRFIYGDFYAAGYLSVTYAAPKTGKSLLALAEGIDAATGRGFLSGEKTEPQRVLYFNAEDDQDVMNARTMAVLQEHGIQQSEILGRFFPVSGICEDKNLVLIKGDRNEIQETAFRFLTDFFRSERITLAIFDPLQDLSQSDESNEAFRALGARIRRLASETGTAVGLIHHTRKPSAGIKIGLDDGRGGGALRGIARFNRLLAPMAEAEGAQAGVGDFRNYFRIAEAESNLTSPSSNRNQWFEKTGVEIGNGEAYPTVRKWLWPEAFAGVTIESACKVRAMLAERVAADKPARRNVQANDWAGNIVADVLGLDVSIKANKLRITAILRHLIETKVLLVEPMPKGPNRKEVDFLIPGPCDPALKAEL